MLKTVTPPTEQRWLVVLVLGLMLSSLVLGWMIRSSVCIDSSWLSALEFDDGHVVPACHTRRSASFDPWLNEVLPTVNQRLRRAEQMLTSLGQTPRAIGSLKISAKDVLATWSLERGLVSRALWNSSPGLEENLLVNLLLETYLVGNPIAGVGSSLEQQMWQELLRQMFADQGLKERHAFLLEWMSRLKSTKNPLTGETAWDISAKTKKKSQFLGYDFSSRHWNLPTLVFVDRTLPAKVEKELRRHRISSLSPEGLQFPFSPDHFSLGEMAPVRASKLLMVRCRFPDLAELEFLGVEFEHVVLVQSCRDVSPEFLVSATANTPEFALRYPDSQVVHIHWPSLRMALSRSGVRARSVASLFEPRSLQSFKKVGFLTEITKDEDTGLGQWNGALEPVLYFRF